MKKIRPTGITGQQGVNLIERVVLGMGSLWHATGGLEAGIDGFIEFRDPTTDEVLNLHLPVQSKARKDFNSETATTVTFACDPDDIEYWTKGNKPVVLVVSRAGADEAYWVSTKDYFRDPKRRKSRKVVFSKATDRFDVAARDRLLKLAASDGGGTYLAPLRVPEQIYSNLLTVTRLPARLFHGYTECSRGKEIRERLVAASAGDVQEWATRGKRVLSVHDLSSGPWREICDTGTVEEFETEEWARSTDDERRSDFVELLGQCLRARLGGLHVRYDRDLEHYHFTSTHDLTPRFVNYRSFSQETRRTVFLAYPRKDDADTVAYYRHHAFSGRFRTYDGEWYLQIDPTYRYTSDGKNIHPLASAHLSGMRRLENNPAVIGQVVMWAYLLRDSENRDLFDPEIYPHLGFGSLASFESPVGINDASWLSSDEGADAEQAGKEAAELNLFEQDGTP